jgi:hypothetical protein
MKRNGRSHGLSKNTCYYGKATRVAEAHGTPFLLSVSDQQDQE